MASGSERVSKLDNRKFDPDIFEMSTMFEYTKLEEMESNEIP